MTFADKIDNRLNAELGHDFYSGTNDNSDIVLAVVNMDISVDMDTESITARFYGYSVGGSGYNEDMVKLSGGCIAVARKLAHGGVAEKIVATTIIEYYGDDAADIGKALVALQNIWEELRCKEA